MVPLVDTASSVSISGEPGPLTDGASSGMGDTLEQQRKVGTIYGYPGPEPISIEISDDPIEVDQHSAFASYDNLLLNFQVIFW